MRAMILRSAGSSLLPVEMQTPSPQGGQILIRVHACGVCRTDLHIVDGELPRPQLPVLPGHEIVGRVAALGEGTVGFSVGDRIGVPWLGSTCGTCKYCRDGLENLCDNARFTGYDIAGGYAEYTLADHRFCFAIPDNISDEHAAPLLCAGLIGYRAYRMAGNVRNLGIYGFGAAAHILTQVALAQDVSVYAFTREGDLASQDFARSMGAVWAGSVDAQPPSALDAAIIFAPAGALIPAALRAVRKGGRVICAGIHMSDIPSFPYHLLWGERSLASVANLTRQDAIDFFGLIRTLSIQTYPVTYDLMDANQALADLRSGRLQGAAVLIIGNRYAPT